MSALQAVDHDAADMVLRSDGIADWCEYVAHHRPAVEIAAARGIHRTTVARRIVAIEALRDCAAWSEILDRMSAASASGRLGSCGEIGPAAAVHVISGGTIDAARRGFCAVAPGLAAGARIVLAPRLGDRAAILLDGQPVLSPPSVSDVLVWVLMGWVADPAPTGRLAKLSITDLGRRADMPTTDSDRRSHGSHLARSLAETIGARVTRLRQRGDLNDRQAAIALRIAAEHAGHPQATAAVIGAALQPLARDWTALVLDLVARGVKSEVVEAANGLPARSARVVLAMLLDLIAAHVAAEGLWP